MGQGMNREKHLGRVRRVRLRSTTKSKNPQKKNTLLKKEAQRRDSKDDRRLPQGFFDSRQDCQRLQAAPTGSIHGRLTDDLTDPPGRSEPVTCGRVPGQRRLRLLSDAAQLTEVTSTTPVIISITGPREIHDYCDCNLRVPGNQKQKNNTELMNNECKGRTPYPQRSSCPSRHRQ